jgi:ABC-type nitrate/sulfonate/bicarbonate transport system substrate-binding protein
MSCSRTAARSHRATLAAAMALCAFAECAAAQQPTAWGWPQPYERVPAAAVQWLKDKGWWPMTVAFQPPWSGQNTLNIVMDREGLLSKRGVEATWQGFPSGPAINEVMVSARAQVGSGGNFPFTSLLDKKVPVKAIAILSPNLLHAVVVPLASPLKSLKDLKGVAEPATFGIVTGSSAEFYFQMAAQVNGLALGKDVILKNMPPGEQMAMPKGISGVVPWDPTPTMMVEERKNGRIIDSIFPYNMYEGNFYVRQELIDHAAEVVQAFADAYLEATLWIRLNPEKAAELMAEDPNLKNYSKAILLQQIKAYNNLYKPTYIYPLAKFWGEANAPIFKWLHEQHRIQNALQARDFEAAVDARFLDRSFAKVGWKVPTRPPFIPANWTGKLDALPYPDYVHPINTQSPQPFPEKGDLVKPWSFGGQTFTP